MAPRSVLERKIGREDTNAVERGGFFLSRRRHSGPNKRRPPDAGQRRWDPVRADEKRGEEPRAARRNEASNSK